MKDYIWATLNESANVDEIIRLFFLHPMSRREKQSYNQDQLSDVAQHLIDILEKTSIEHILDIIEEYKDEIPIISTGSIPQFCQLEDADRVPDIVLSNPNCKYKLIGYFFNKNAADYSNQKYGENHYKLAAQLGICEYADKKAEDGITAVSFLGYVYKDLPKFERDILRPRLCLQVPFIQHILVEARHGKIDAMSELESILTKATSVRRRSSIQQMMHAIEKSMTSDRNIMNNIIWGYKKDA